MDAINANIDGFNPRSPRGGATLPVITGSLPCVVSFNPRSPRGGATRAKFIYCWDVFVSIHAPHEGERQSVQYLTAKVVCVSIHAPHEGERQQ